MFVVHEFLILIQDATFINYKTGTKIRGRRTVESTAVLSKHLFRSSCSDLPSLFNFKFIFMHEQMDKLVGTCEACGQPKELTIDEILEDFFSWRSAKSFKESLWGWFITAVGSDDMDNWTAHDRSNLAFLYNQLTEFVEKLESIHLKTSA